MSTIRNTTSMTTLRSAASTLKKHFEKADANKDGRVTETEIKRYAKGVPDAKKVGTAMLTVFNWSLDERHLSVNVKLAKQNVDEAVALAKARDKNNNGKIDVGAELNAANRLKTFQALANLASAGDVVATGRGLTAKKLGEAIAPFVADAYNYTSEGDANPEFFSVSGTRGVTPSNVFDVLKGPIASFFDEQDGDLSEYAVEVPSRTTAKSFLSDLVSWSKDADDVASAKAWSNIEKLMRDNVSDLKILKVGPRGDESGGLGLGTLAYVVVGKTSDGKTAGFILGSVET